MADIGNLMRSIEGFSGVDVLTVLAAFDEGVIIADRDGKILFYNETQAQIDEMDAEDALGQNVLDIYSFDTEDSKIFRCIRSGKPIRGELFFYRTRRGKVANTIHSVFPLLRGERVVGAVCFTKDYNLLEKTVISSSANLTEPDSTRRKLGNGTRYRFSDIVGADDKILQAVKIARLAADSPSSIMLWGETGTGKELFAQSIHNYSSRSRKRFIGINCAAIPENLLEGLLFGTSRGAFTGAVDRAGIFEQAQGGTLFLDEVNSMPLNLQAKLLRVIQEKKVRRVGASEDIDVEAKIISSVNTSPHLAIERGSLRIDLFYRLGVVFIPLPPLREQLGGLSVLVQHFIHKNNLAMGKQVRGVSDDVMQYFRQYRWPGNIRELEHIIEGTMNIIQSEPTIERSHLPAHFLSPEFKKIEDVIPFSAPNPEALIGIIPPPAPADAPAPPANETGGLLGTQRSRERAMIENALLKTRGNVSKASALLGISRQLLHYKMKKNNLNRRMFGLSEGEND